MSWLLRDGDVLAAIDGDGRGWAGTIQGAVVRRGPVLAHTLTCATARDLAWCVPGRDEAGEPCLEVRRIASLRPRRVGLPQMRRGVLVVAEQGAFERWNLHVGDRLEIRDT